MHVISRKVLREFWETHPDSQGPLSRWFKIVDRSDFTSFSDLRLAFPSADKVDSLIVLNIRGNKYRLIALVHFSRGKLYVRRVLAHAEYARGEWKE